MKLSKRQAGIGIIILGVLLFAVLAVIKTNLDEQGAFLCKAVEADPELSMEECPAHKQSTSWVMTLAFVLAFLVIICGIYLTSAPLPVERKPSKPPKLADDEKKVYEVLKSSEGSMYQSDLIKETGFSKVKMTRVLDRLEGKKVIDRKRRGMTNVVILR